jgi:hypothetical protein
MSLINLGDLDGDQYTVIWDKELVQPKIAEVRPINVGFCHFLTFFSSTSYILL